MCPNAIKRPDAKPLTPACVQELKDEDCAALIMELDGVQYNSEDLYSCASCGTKFVSASDLYEERCCESCVEEGREEAEYQHQLRAEYYYSSL